MAGTLELIQIFSHQQARLSEKKQNGKNLKAEKNSKFVIFVWKRILIWTEISNKTRKFEVMWKKRWKTEHKAKLIKTIKQPQEGEVDTTEIEYEQKKIIQPADQ